MEKSKPVNIEHIMNLEGKARLDIKINYGLLLFVGFMAEQNGMSVPEYINNVFKEGYEKFKKRHNSLYYNKSDESFYMEK